MVLMAVVCNKYSFCCIRGFAHFCPKANSRENRFFAARLAIGDENGTHNVKIYADKLTKASPPTPLKKGKSLTPQPLLASPPTPLQRGEGSGMLCWLIKPHPQPLSKGERGVVCFVG